jgi:hypothetical protein
MPSTTHVVISRCEDSKQRLASSQREMHVWRLLRAPTSTDHGRIHLINMCRPGPLHTRIYIYIFVRYTFNVEIMHFGFGPIESNSAGLPSPHFRSVTKLMSELIFHLLYSASMYGHIPTVFVFAKSFVPMGSRFGPSPLYLKFVQQIYCIF